MADKIFLDANVIVDFALQREYGDDAELVLDLVVNRGIKGYISSSILHISGYWISKDKGSDKAKEFLLTLLKNITVIDIPHDIAVMALSSTLKDIEDALQYYTALHHKLDFFISRDKALQKASIPALPVFTPKEFLELYS